MAVVFVVAAEQQGCVVDAGIGKADLIVLIVSIGD